MVSILTNSGLLYLLRRFWLFFLSHVYFNWVDLSLISCGKSFNLDSWKILFQQLLCKLTGLALRIKVTGAC